jgi:hypothetical protein
VSELHEALAEAAVTAEALLESIRGARSALASAPSRGRLQRTQILAGIHRGAFDALHHAFLLRGYREGLAARTALRERVLAEVPEPAPGLDAVAQGVRIERTAVILAAILGAERDADWSAPAPDAPKKPGPLATARRAATHLVELTGRTRAVLRPLLS